jgi:hypothetical protein
MGLGFRCLCQVRNECYSTQYLDSALIAAATQCTGRPPQQQPHCRFVISRKNISAELPTESSVPTE